MNVLILAGGLGSRLNRYTSGQYPKILLSVGNETFLDKVINFWFNEQKVAEMTLVFSEDSHIKQVKEYIRNFHYNLERDINVLKYSKTDGTFNTLYYTLLANLTLLKDDLIISWSDILPTKPLELRTQTGIKIFTDSNKIHRYEINSQNTIRLSSNNSGNIPGIYNLKNASIEGLRKFKEDNSGFKEGKEVDFIEYLQDEIFSDFRDSIISTEEIDILDIGDSTKYLNYLDGVSVAQRWFNDIEFNDNVVIKKANSQHGNKVMESEIEFYKHIQKEGLQKCFPNIIQMGWTKGDLDQLQMKCQEENFFNLRSNTFIKMENLYSSGFTTVNTYLSSNGVGKEKYLMKSYLDAISVLRKDIYKCGMNEHIFKEYIQVCVERYSKIEYFIPKSIRVVTITDANGKENSTVLKLDFYSMIDKLQQRLSSQLFNWGTIHGDTNTTNTMYNERTGEIKFIDPRGKFGDINIYGDTDYDIAKFVYGLTGYDTFNLHKDFHFEINNDEISINMPKLGMIDELTDSEHVKILVGLIWLKLPYYIKNNPNKVIASYFIGMHLLHKYLN